jgi:peptidoglycan/xylan/chitin deacetylase (PgdA/CDA1 family)
MLREFKLPATVFVATGYLNDGRMFNDSVVETVRSLDTGEINLEQVGLGKRLVTDVASRRTLIADLTKAVKYLEPAQRNAFCEELCRRAGSRLPTDLMMTEEQVRAMSREEGIDIGGHTVSHPILARIDLDESRREIETNRDQITTLTGAPPRCFAYPNGKPNLDYTSAHARMVSSVGYQAAVSTAVGVAAEDADPFQLPRFMPRERSAAQFVARMVRMAAHRHRQVAD